MGRTGKFSMSDMKKLQAMLKKIHDADKDAFLEACAKELAARLMAKVIKRTPVGDYPKGSGRKGGTLKRGWTTQKSGSGAEGLKVRSARKFVDTLKVHKFGGVFVIEIENPIEYASYVEYGHRTATHKGWVPGRFMLTISEQEIQAIAPKVLEKKIMKFLGECMK